MNRHTASSTTAAGLTARIKQQKPSLLEGELACVAGQLLALVGPSGAGKTSFLRALAGLSRPAEGRIEVNGKVWFDSSAQCFLPPSQRAVGLVFQNYALMPHLSAIDNVALAQLALPVAQRRQMASQWLTKVGLSDDEQNRPPARLSGGQQQRVALARALIRQPDLLLLDEPFSAVDQMSRQRLYELLAQLREELQIPIVLVTHDLNEARLLSDRMAVMDQGLVMQSGLPAEIYRRPRTRRVADLIGIQNRFSGVWLGPAEQAGYGLLRWHKTLKPEHLDAADGPLLRVYDKGKIPANHRVNWVVPGDGLVLVRQKPEVSRTAHIWLPVTVRSIRDLGEISLVEVMLNGPPGRLIRLTQSGVQRGQHQVNEPLWLGLDQGLIHIMPRRKSSGQSRQRKENK